MRLVIRLMLCGLIEWLARPVRARTLMFIELCAIVFVLLPQH